MKHFFGATLLLMLFLTLSLSFCLLQFHVYDNPLAPAVSVHYNEENGVHVTLSSRVGELASDIAQAVRNAAEALPFFAVDAADKIAREVKEVFSLLGEILTSEDGSLFV